MNQLSTKTRRVLSVALVLVIFLCILVISVSNWKKYRAQKEYEHLQATAIKEPVNDPLLMPELDTEEKIPIPDRYEEYPQVDFETLWEINEEVCAWIRVPGTEVDYPILRNGDASDIYDTYYLNTTIDGVEGLPGSIYMEPCNSPEFTDYNTVIYGHNMKDGTMFTGLHQYKEEGFLEAHPYIYIVTPEKRLVYEIVSAVVSDDRHIIYSFDFYDTQGRETYLAFLADNTDERNQYREDLTPDAEDRLLTLSTCIGNENDRRLLVTGILIEEE